MATGSGRDVLYTYRYLRGAMVALLLALLLAPVLQWWSGTGASCWLGSLSAYYYSPSRTMFVGSLCALGALLVAYKGHSPEEDVLLDFSGLMAFLVAVVPTVPDTRCGPTGYSLTSAEIADAVQNGVWTLVVVVLLAAVVVLALSRRARTDARAEGRDDRPSRRTVVVGVVCATVVVAELVLFLFLRQSFIALSHDIAAATMVLGVIAVMMLSGLRTDDRHDDSTVAARYRRTYLALALALGGLLAVTVAAQALLRGLDHVVLVGEVVILVVFAAYWVVQTIELWNLVDPGDVERRGAAGSVR